MKPTSDWTKRVPKVGMRNIKTSLAAAICALIYAFFPNRSPAFACIGAIFGMGSDLQNSKLNGGNRFFGTIIGGLIGIVLFRFYLIFYPEGGHHWLLIPLTFIGTMILIILCQMFWVGGVQPGGVVLCIVLFNISYSFEKSILSCLKIYKRFLFSFTQKRSGHSNKSIKFLIRDSIFIFPVL